MAAKLTINHTPVPEAELHRYVVAAPMAGGLPALTCDDQPISGEWELEPGELTWDCDGDTMKARLGIPPKPTK